MTGKTMSDYAREAMDAEVEGKWTLDANLWMRASEMTFNSTASTIWAKEAEKARARARDTQRMGKSEGRQGLDTSEIDGPVSGAGRKEQI